MEAYFVELKKIYNKTVRSVGLNIKAGSRCNFVIFQWEPDLTFGKRGEIWNDGHLKQASALQKSAPKMNQTGKGMDL